MGETTQVDGKTTWQPEPRPEWVAKVNAEGQCMDIRGIVPLDEDSLIRAAQESTQLSDFGDNDWREPFRVFIKALEEEADLNLMGRIRTRHQIHLMLCAKLQIEDWYRRHPEIEDQEVTQPIVIVGQGRSGTSFMLNTLEAHPHNGAIRQWEAVFPCPPPEAATYESDPRIQRAHAICDQWNRVTPEMASMHEFGAQIPEECVHVMAINFMSVTWLNLMGQVPSYSQYCATLDWTKSYRQHKRILKLLQWKNPRKHWVLKAPEHLDHLPALVGGLSGRLRRSDEP